MKPSALAALTIAVATLSACQMQGDIYVTDAWVRLPAVAGRPAAAYFTLHGYSKPSALTNVSSEVAQRTEMHETMERGGMTTMAPLERVALPPRAEVRFAPGGKHVMLFNVNAAIKPGSTVPLRLTFTGFPRIDVDAVAVAAGAPAPASE